MRRLEKSPWREAPRFPQASIGGVELHERRSELGIRAGIQFAAASTCISPITADNSVSLTPQLYSLFLMGAV
jgi:hypothetical protein